MERPTIGGVLICFLGLAYLLCGAVVGFWAIRHESFKHLRFPTLREVVDVSEPRFMRTLFTIENAPVFNKPVCVEKLPFVLNRLLFDFDEDGVGKTEKQYGQTVLRWEREPIHCGR